MSYLLWQIFLCLLLTAALFFALGWLVRSWFRGQSAADNLVADSERSSWQTSLDIVKSRLEAETSRKLAAERALQDSHSQQAKLSTLLDQNSTEIQILTQELAEKSSALDRCDALDAEVAALHSQAATRNQSLREAIDQVAQLQAQAAKLQEAEAALNTVHSQVSDLESKLRSAAEENGKLRTQVAQIAPKLAMAAAAGAEVIALKAQVAQLEPQVSKLQTSDGDLGKLRGQLSDLQQKLQASNEEVGRLRAQESDLNEKLANMQTSSGETTKHLADLETRNRAFADENTRLKAEVAELAPKLVAAEAAAAKLRIRLGELEAQLAGSDNKLRTDDDELASFKKRWVEQEGKFHAVGEENTRLKAQLAEYEPRLKQAQLYESELMTLRIRVAEIEPQVHQWEARYTKTVAEKDAELSQCRSRVAELDAKLSHDHAPPKGERDDLKKIFGIGPVLEKRLHGLGVYYFRDIANWSKEDILRYEEHLKEFRDRIERDHWVEGAREEHFKKYGERLLNSKAANA